MGSEGLGLTRAFGNGGGRQVLLGPRPVIGPQPVGHDKSTKSGKTNGRRFFISSVPGTVFPRFRFPHEPNRRERRGRKEATRTRARATNTTPPQTRGQTTQQARTGRPMGSSCDTVSTATRDGSQCAPRARHATATKRTHVRDMVGEKRERKTATRVNGHGPRREGTDRPTHGRTRPCARASDNSGGQWACGDQGKRFSPAVARTRQQTLEQGKPHGRTRAYEGCGCGCEGHARRVTGCGGGRGSDYENDQTWRATSDILTPH